jgi:CAAX prenyl protease-like protein
LITAFLTAALYVILKLHYRKPVVAPLGWLIPSRFYTVISILGGVAAALAITYLTRWRGHMMPAIAAKDFIILGLLLGPILEESVFRGCILPVLTRTLGSAISVGAIAVLFAAFHAPGDVTHWVWFTATGAAYGSLRLASQTTSARLKDAISRYIDWEAFAYWSRPALRQSLKSDWRNGKALRNRAHRFGELTSRVQRQAQERAAELARRVPWQVLLETRNQYLAWQEFYFWARSIMESERTIPEWLARKLNEVCPGFLDAEERKAGRDTKAAELAAVRLGEWIDNQIFAFAEKGGWLPGVTFYAVREPRYQRASTCWSESVKKWRTTKPDRYPSLDEWRLNAATWDESAHLLPEIRKQRECFNLVDV